MMKLRIETIGDDLGVLLPDDLATRLNVDEGDTAIDAELENGGLRLTPKDRALSMLDETDTEPQ